jgi:hypothetical protein
MKINLGELKVGSRLRSFDAEDNHWYITEVKNIAEHKITLVDVDNNSLWQGMEWDVSLSELQDEKSHKTL